MSDEQVALAARAIVESTPKVKASIPELGRFVKKLLEKYTLKEISEKVGRSPSTLRRWKKVFEQQLPVPPLPKKREELLGWLVQMELNGWEFAPSGYEGGPNFLYIINPKTREHYKGPMSVHCGEAAQIVMSTFFWNEVKRLKNENPSLS